MSGLNYKPDQIPCCTATGGPALTAAIDNGRSSCRARTYRPTRSGSGGSPRLVVWPEPGRSPHAPAPQAGRDLPSGQGTCLSLAARVSFVLTHLVALASVPGVTRKVLWRSTHVSPQRHAQGTQTDGDADRRNLRRLFRGAEQAQKDRLTQQDVLDLRVRSGGDQIGERHG